MRRWRNVKNSQRERTDSNHGVTKITRTSCILTNRNAVPYFSSLPPPLFSFLPSSAIQRVEKARLIMSSDYSNDGICYSIRKKRRLVLSLVCVLFSVVAERPSNKQSTLLTYSRQHEADDRFEIFCSSRREKSRWGDAFKIKACC